MTPLNPYNFGHRDPEPKREDYKYQPEGYLPEDEFEIDNEAYQKALSDWKTKNIEPEPEWISFEEREPETGWHYKNIIKGHSGTWALKWWGQEHDRKVWDQLEGRHIVLDTKETYWADKTTYYQRLAYYQQHQTIFEGWKEIESQDHLTFRKNGHEVSFWKTSVHRFWILMCNATHITYNGEIPDGTTFRSICEINGIEV